MRFAEFYENVRFDELEYTKQTPEGREVDYDVINDLIVFINNYDPFYRSKVIPLIAACVDLRNQHKKISIDLFKPVVKEGYKLYCAEYPIRELPDQLDDADLKKACSALLKDLSDEISAGKYKDF